MIGGLIDTSELSRGERRRIGNEIGSFISHAAPPGQEFAIGSLHGAIVAGRTPLGQGPHDLHTVDINTMPILQIRQSGVHGLGVFAMCEFFADDYIVAVRSRILHHYTVQPANELLYIWRYPADSLWVHNQFEFEYSNIARYINATEGEDEGNVHMVSLDNDKLLVIRATRDIDEDEELLCEYVIG